MIAKQLERIIGEIGHRSETEMVQRFQKLRNTSIFPTSRGKHAEALTLNQIAAGILSIVPTRAGHTAHVISLLDLRPVGGERASFYRADTLGKAIETLLGDKEAMMAFLELRASSSEIDTQGSGGTAEIVYVEGGELKTAYFVQKTAISLMAEGADEDYKPRAAFTQVRQETVYYKKVFQSISKQLGDEKRYQSHNIEPH